MDKKQVRTRFAPSPTGYMHIGNLRTALYAYLFAKHEKGKFVLRIEDTDQKRFVEGATEVIYQTLKQTNMIHDEGPDIGGNYGPYVQSERKPLYKDYALQLVENGNAYYCFCTNDKEENTDGEAEQTFGYNRHCRNLSKEEIEKNLAAGKPYVIRQKMPLEGTTTFHDEVYGDVTVQNDSLDDQILLKSDGMPTYNFANVVDDHLMAITHVIRGKEYISSTPKYELLYRAFGWETPKTVHLSTIMGQNPDGTVSKLSKRHGAVSFAQLLEDGYLQEAIINYIALLGWSPRMEREVFSLEELVELFDIEGVVKTNAIFDYKKLDWFNAIYINEMSHEDFVAYSQKYIVNLPKYLQEKWEFASTLAQTRISKFNDIVSMFKFLDEYTDFDLTLFENKKNKLDKAQSLEILKDFAPILQNTQDWSVENLNTLIQDYTTLKEYKIGKTMWPLRIGVTGQTITPGGGAEMLYLLGKAESLKRINRCIERLAQ
ncbi:MAG: glutamate--tRNA ligase [Clostridiales bacterium]|nr:glutamate--tRNA ligase [Clostridiales bacterium]